MGNFSAILAREYMDIYVNIDRHHTWGAFRNSWMYVILSKLGQHVNEMIAVTVKSVLF